MAKMHDHDRRVLTRMLRLEDGEALPQDVEEIYATYQHAYHGVAQGPLPPDSMLTICYLAKNGYTPRGGRGRYFDDPRADDQAAEETAAEEAPEEAGDEESESEATEEQPLDPETEAEKQEVNVNYKDQLTPGILLGRQGDKYKVKIAGDDKEYRLIAAEDFEPYNG